MSEVIVGVEEAEAVFIIGIENMQKDLVKGGKKTIGNTCKLWHYLSGTVIHGTQTKNHR